MRPSIIRPTAILLSLTLILGSLPSSATNPSFTRAGSGLTSRVMTEALAIRTGLYSRSSPHSLAIQLYRQATYQLKHSSTRIPGIAVVLATSSILLGVRHWGWGLLYVVAMMVQGEGDSSMDDASQNSKSETSLTTLAAARRDLAQFLLEPAHAGLAQEAIEDAYANGTIHEINLDLLLNYAEGLAEPFAPLPPQGSIRSQLFGYLPTPGRTSLQNIFNLPLLQFEWNMKSLHFPLQETLWGTLIATDKEGRVTKTEVWMLCYPKYFSTKFGLAYESVGHFQGMGVTADRKWQLYRERVSNTVWGLSINEEAREKEFSRTLSLKLSEIDRLPQYSLMELIASMPWYGFALQLLESDFFKKWRQTLSLSDKVQLEHTLSALEQGKTIQDPAAWLRERIESLRETDPPLANEFFIPGKVLGAVYIASIDLSLTPLAMDWLGELLNVPGNKAFATFKKRMDSYLLVRIRNPHTIARAMEKMKSGTPANRADGEDHSAVLTKTIRPLIETALNGYTYKRISMRIALNGKWMTLRPNEFGLTLKEFLDTYFPRQLEGLTLGELYIPAAHFHKWTVLPGDDYRIEPYKPTHTDLLNVLRLLDGKIRIGFTLFLIPFILLGTVQPVAAVIAFVGSIFTIKASQALLRLARRTHQGWNLLQTVFWGSTALLVAGGLHARSFSFGFVGALTSLIAMAMTEGGGLFDEGAPKDPYRSMWTMAGNRRHLLHRIQHLTLKGSAHEAIEDALAANILHQDNYKAFMEYLSTLAELPSIPKNHASLKIKVFGYLPEPFTNKNTGNIFNLPILRFERNLSTLKLLPPESDIVWGDLISLGKENHGQTRTAVWALKDPTYFSMNDPSISLGLSYMAFFGGFGVTTDGKWQLYRHQATNTLWGLAHDRSDLEVDDRDKDPVIWLRREIAELIETDPQRANTLFIPGRMQTNTDLWPEPSSLNESLDWTGALGEVFGDDYEYLAALGYSFSREGLIWLGRLLVGDADPMQAFHAHVRQYQQMHLGDHEDLLRMLEELTTEFPTVAVRALAVAVRPYIQAAYKALHRPDLVMRIQVEGYWKEFPLTTIGMPLREFLKEFLPQRLEGIYFGDKFIPETHLDQWIVLPGDSYRKAPDNDEITKSIKGLFKGNIRIELLPALLPFIFLGAMKPLVAIFLFAASALVLKISQSINLFWHPEQPQLIHQSA